MSRWSPFTVLAVMVVCLAIVPAPLIEAGSRVAPVSTASSPAGNTIVVPPGANALTSAITAAGKGGTVQLQTGLHTESGTVLIMQSVSLVGEAGAILESTTPLGTSFPLPIQPAIHVRGAADVRIQGLTLRPTPGTEGNYAIALENAPRAIVTGNAMTGYQGGVMVELSNDVQISSNDIQVGTSFPEHGIVIMNGRGARVMDNRASGATFAIWACDRGGFASGNQVSGSFVGLILCKVPPMSYEISGVPRGSSSPGQGWTVRENTATGNTWGYLVIDDANTNSLSRNSASGNFLYDMELTSDTYRFGFLTPASFDNTVHERNMTIKDCGNNNRIIGSGATIVDNNTDPCF